MKKLCTYLTLFVLGLLCFAQPVAAEDVTIYFKNTKGWEKPSIHWFRFDGVSDSPSPQEMDLVPGTEDVYVKTLSGATIKDHASDKSQASGIIFTSKPSWDNIDRYDYETAPTKVKNGYIYDANGSYKEYVVETPPSEDADRVFYVKVEDAQKVAWGDDCYVYTWDATEEYKWTSLNKVVTHYTEKLSDGVYKFVLKDQKTVGRMLLKGKPGTGDNDWKPQTENILGADFKNNRLWIIGAMSGDKYTVTSSDSYTEPTPVAPFEPGTSKVWISGSLNANANGDMPCNGKIYSFGPFKLTSDGHFSIWYGEESDKSDVKHNLANASGTGFTLATGEAAATTVKFGASAVNALYMTQTTKGSIKFDAENMKLWFEEEVEDEQPTLSASPAECEFDGEIKVTLTATPDNAEIYYTLNGDTPGKASTRYNGEITISDTKTIKAIAFNGTKQTEVMSWTYTKKQAASDWTAIPSSSTVYIKASFINNWGGFVAMTYDTDNSLWFYDFTVDNGQRAFVMSTASDGNAENDGIVITHKASTQTWAIPTSRPADDQPNARRTGHTSGHNFTVTESGRIWFDPAKGQVWYEGTEGRPAQAYIAAESFGGNPWGDNVTTMNWDKDLKVWRARVNRATKFMVSLKKDDFWSGRYEAIGGGELTIPSEKPESANIKLGGNIDLSCPAAGNIYFDPEALKVWYTPTETTGFQQGKTYYVNVDGVVKDGKHWWGSANLGYKFSDGALRTGSIVTPNSLYSFVCTEAGLTQVTIGRKVGDKVYNELIVKAPTDGGNVIYLKGNSGNLEFDRWGYYEQEDHVNLYILGSFLGDGWGSASPIQMTYDEKTGLYSYYVGEAAELTLSLGRTTAEFWNADRRFMHVRGADYNVIHMAEPTYNNLKHGHADKTDLKLFCASHVYARYDVSDPENPVMRVWCTPDDGQWPDLYIIGAIIAPDSDTQGESSNQWKAIRKLDKVESQPGLYSYELTKASGFFNTNDYIAAANPDGVQINEIGHFNFSFMSGTNVETFWTDPFCPATKGMAFLNRDGVPEPFIYRGHDATRTNWTSTNFVFAEEATVYVDAVRQLVWVELKKEKAATDVVFHFWDKGGVLYPAGEYPDYRWWNTRSDMSCELYIPGTEIKQTVIVDGNKNSIVEAMTEGQYSYEYKVAGMKYKFVITELPTDFLVQAGEGNSNDFATLKDNIWVRIKKGNDESKVIERPYVHDAIYTQGPKDNVTYNEYGEIGNFREPVVTIMPDVNVIHSRVKVPKHPGRVTEDQMIIYPYVNQFFAKLRIYQDVLPFSMTGVTGSDLTAVVDEEGNDVLDRNGNQMYGYEPQESKRDFFKKFNHAVLEYGTIREIREGSTGVGLIKGLDFANAADEDNLSIRVTYMSEGMIFDLSKVMMLNEYKVEDSEADKIAGKLPNLQTSDKNEPTVKYFFGSSDHMAENNEISNKNHVALDMIIDMPFAFREVMRQNRAAYIGFEVEFTESDANDHVTSENMYAAEYGRPLTWTYMDEDIKEHSADNWHYEGFYDNHLAVQLHHVVCAESKEAMKTKSAAGKITYHMIVPVATDFSFTTGEAATMALSRARITSVNGEEKAPLNVIGDPNDPYVGSISGSSYASFSKDFKFIGGTNVPTGVESVDVENVDVPVEFYNLQGIRMDRESLAPGIYIRRQGNTASKVYIR